MESEQKESKKVDYRNFYAPTAEWTLDCGGEWTLDCGGKMDHDGTVVEFDSRYYPPRKGGPSAYCSMHLNFYRASGCYNDSVYIVSEEFRAETPSQVQQQVESWIQEQYSRIAKALYAEFGPGKDSLDV